ncbi:6,7-dimethyl-8-ribityllumazine synthase [Ferruginibacter albus]|uniref:6,7-dimethyl-8-ribityllumazine synthase n=1 Tax=Ferruginibacter albus TaxID=2875540 RepID=UPI001CC43453|nr:6,7-dimethyl-8-ribityllumazine synthase [Ferruginibacter albus]UAY50907.1 6,7-dimethyl-8-ribityllumazine synthase [Ferruginibacter albus]
MATIESSNLYNITGIQLPKDACVVIVRTEWNAAIIDKLDEGCRKVLDQHKISFTVLTVPGAFEIPFAVKTYWDIHKGKQDEPAAFITLGCVLRGDTPHFDYVCQSVTSGVSQLNLLLPVPTIFGILTVDNQQQADERTGGKHGHKGEEAAITAIKMIALTNAI